LSARTRSPPSTLAPTLCTAAPTPFMISAASSTSSAGRCRGSGTPSETRTPSGCAPSAARSDRAAAAARHPISRKVSQSVRKWTSCTLASMLTARMVPPSGISAQSSPRSPASGPRPAIIARMRSNSPPGPRGMWPAAGPEGFIGRARPGARDAPARCRWRPRDTGR
jgi:hypothetical protein